MLTSSPLSFFPSICPCLRLSVRPQATNRLLLDACVWNLIFDYFYKICPRTFKFYKTINAHLWWCRIAFFLEWKIFQTSCVENSKHTLCVKYIFSPRKSRLLWDNVDKNGTAGQATEVNIIQDVCITFWKLREEYTHTHTHTFRTCDTHCFSTATIVARKRLIVTLYLHCLCSCEAVESISITHCAGICYDNISKQVSWIVS